MEARKNYKTAIILLGPTAAGKTAAAIQLARTLNTEIISADSRQCFQELNIGVARPSITELDAVRHYFIASHSIHQDVNAALFEGLSLDWAEKIFRQHETLVMVGGTGLYINAFADGLDAIPAVDPDIRRMIQDQFRQHGIAWLRQQVKDSDPEFYQVGEILNPHRLMRALEVKLSAGKSILDFRNKTKKQRPFRIIKIGLTLPKEILHESIHYRVDRMMESGLLEEARSLLPHKQLNALRTVGYTELFDHLEGGSTLEQAVSAIKVNTRHYAKRQLTWFRKDPAVQWIDSRDRPALEEIAKKITNS